MGSHIFSIKKRWLEKLWEKNVTIALTHGKKEKMYPTYIWNHNSNCGKQAVFLMVPNAENKKCVLSRTLATQAKSDGCEAKTATMTFSCSKKTISIIKTNNFYASWWVLSLALLSCFRKRKQTWIG